MTEQITGTLRRVAPGSSIFTGELAFGPARYTLDGVGKGASIDVEFRHKGRTAARATFAAPDWTCRVTLHGFPWIIRCERGALTGEPAPADELVAAGVLPF